MQNSFLRSLVGVLFLSGVFLAVSAPAHAGGCGQDPVYERRAVGQAITGANVRNIACMDGSAVVTTVRSGVDFKVIAETDGWYKVKLADGTMGWIGARLVKLVDTTNDVKVRTDENAMDTDKMESHSSAETVERDEALVRRLHGYILLKVEHLGEAYYVNDDGIAYYMKDGDAAYALMRELGLGISNSDFDSLESGNTTLRDRLKGKILLKVQQHGEAYYVHPVKGTLHYLRDGRAAYTIMRELGLGISNTDISHFIKKDKPPVRTGVEEKTSGDLEPSTGTILLSAMHKGDGKVQLDWTLSGMEFRKGLKILKSKDTIDPVYPDHAYEYHESNDLRSRTLLLSPGTYYFRVCEYIGNACGVYSNTMQVDIE